MDQLSRTIKLQMIVFIIIAIASVATVGICYIGLPALLFGVGRYTVTVQLPASGDLYPSGNVTYRGTEVGRVEAVRLTDTGVEAVLSLNSDVSIPSDLEAQVHSQTAIGEQYVALLPRNDTSAPLKNGDVISRDRASVPPNINTLLDATSKGLQAIPNDNVKTVIDESYSALGGLGPEFTRFVNGATTLAIDANKHLDDLTAVVDQAAPVLDSQTDTSDEIQSWAANLADVTQQLRTQDSALAGVLERGAPAADEARQLFDRLQPTVPLILANLVSVGEVAVAYQPNLEQLLVLLPQGIAEIQGTAVANRNTKQDYAGMYLSFNTANTNLPPPCTTGFLPAQQVRPPMFVDTPDRPPGDLYCRVPQDSMWNPRGVRNTPCATKPGKRAPTAAMCESDEQYVPLNDGMNWKGDPNATLSGQGVPQLPSESPSAQGVPPPPEASPPPLAAAEYDPATGTYVGPDGKIYTQSNLAQPTPKDQTWQTMLIPPA
jgi:phospholipid/cholesterol/gamma-HCH transport system substrate-binding protein